MPLRPATISPAMPPPSSSASRGDAKPSAARRTWRGKRNALGATSWSRRRKRLGKRRSGSTKSVPKLSRPHGPRPRSGSRWRTTGGRRTEREVDGRAAPRAQLGQVLINVSLPTKAEISQPTLRSRFHNPTGEPAGYHSATVLNPGEPRSFSAGLSMFEPGAYPRTCRVCLLRGVVADIAASRRWRDGTKATGHGVPSIRSHLLGSRELLAPRSYGF